MDRLWASESDVYRRQILTTKVGPGAVGVIVGHGSSWTRVDNVSHDPGWQCQSWPGLTMSVMLWFVDNLFICCVFRCPPGWDGKECDRPFINLSICKYKSFYIGCIQYIVSLDMKGCYFVTWQIHPFISKGTKCSAWANIGKHFFWKGVIFLFWWLLSGVTNIRRKKPQHEWLHLVRWNGAVLNRLIIVLKYQV